MGKTLEGLQIAPGMLAAVVDRAGGGAEIALAAIAQASELACVHIACRGDMTSLSALYEGASDVRVHKLEAGTLGDVEALAELVEGRGLVIVSDFRRACGSQDPWEVLEGLEGLSREHGAAFVIEHRRSSELLDAHGAVWECTPGESHPEAGVKLLRLAQVQKPRGVVSEGPVHHVVVEADGSFELRLDTLSRAQREQADRIAGAMLESLLDAPGRAQPQLEGVTFDVAALAVLRLVQRGQATIRSDGGVERVYPSEASIQARREVDGAVLACVVANPDILESGVAKRAQVDASAVEGAIARLVAAGKVVRVDNHGEPALESLEHRREREAAAAAMREIMSRRCVHPADVGREHAPEHIEAAIAKLKEQGEAFELSGGQVLYLPTAEREVLETLRASRTLMGIEELAEKSGQSFEFVQGCLSRYGQANGLAEYPLSSARLAMSWMYTRDGTPKYEIVEVANA